VDKKTNKNYVQGQDFNLPFDKQSTLEKRFTAMGYGTKSDFTKELREMIDPGSYKIPGFNDLNKGKGFNFGTPRDGMKNTLRNNLSTDSNIPGPAN